LPIHYLNRELTRADFMPFYEAALANPPTAADMIEMERRLVAACRNDLQPVESDYNRNTWRHPTTIPDEAFDRTGKTEAARELRWASAGFSEAYHKYRGDLS
jgi:hypothetical protein